MPDSVFAKAKAKNSFFSKDWVQISFVPSLLFTASAATWNERKNIREIRNRYIPDFRNKFDDYMQYIPAAATYGLKLGGVKGRNNLGRAALSHATSLLIMGALVNVVKHTARVERPDGSARNSFPSGHTSMAFTNATFMHKEYGLVHPLYSIGAYGSATFTALGRGMNNKHWISDVLAGAGIGILSTQLGYFFIDKFYKNKGDNVSLLSRLESTYGNSFLSLKLGYAVASTNFLNEIDKRTSMRMGFELGVEGSYFFTKKWGLGADFSFTSFPINASDIKNDIDGMVFNKFDIDTQSIGLLNFGVGPYFNIDLPKKWNIQLKSMVGAAFGSKGRIFLKYNIPNVSIVDEVIDFAQYKPKTSFRFVVGTSVTYRIREDLGLSYYIDYNYTKPKFDISIADVDNGMLLINAERYSVRERLDYVNSGFRLTAYF